MCKLEITVKANFTSKINLGNTVRRIVLYSVIGMGVLYQQNVLDVNGIKPPENISAYSIVSKK